MTDKNKMTASDKNDEKRTLIRDVVSRVKSNLRVTKVVATRSLKGAKGDTFVGFSAQWDTVQEDGTMGLESTGDDRVPVNAMSLMDAKVAGYLLAMQADIAAHEHGVASGTISSAYCQKAVHGIKANYAKLIKDLFGE